MAIFCITTSNPEFQKLLAESGEKQGVFAMMVSKWMTENEVYDRYPTLQELGITAMDSIKPGVQELFETNPELANNLENKLKTFLKSINVDTIVVDNLQKRLQEKGLNSDAVAVSDILHKAVFLDSNKYNTLDYAEEVATFAIEFMGASNHPEASPLIKTALANITIWEKYQQYYDLYKDDSIYKNNERKLKVEILSKLLAEKIVENKDKTKKTKQDKKLTTLENIINNILALFDKIWKSDYYKAVDRFLKQRGIETKGVNKINIRPFDAVINEIVDDILFNNTSKIINNSSRARKGETVVSLKEVLENNPTIKEIYYKLNSLGFMFTGSPALSQEGTVYRESNKNLHDLDWQVPKELENTWLDLVKSTFPELTYKINPKTNQAQIFSKNDKTTHSLMIKGMPVDFFININPPSTKNKFGDMRWQDTFEAKMDMGRHKDIRDLIDYKTSFNDYFSNPNYVYYSLGQIKPGVAELFDSNPELANIGTQKQYSQYLDTIFPDSKVKDIVYHISNKILIPKKGQLHFYLDSSTRNSENYKFHILKNLESILINKETDSKNSGLNNVENYIFDNFNYEFFTSEWYKNPLNFYNNIIDKAKEDNRLDVIEYLKGKETNAILNIQNPYNEVSESINKTTVDDIRNKNKTDGIIGQESWGYGLDKTEKEIVVFEPEQIHILGSKQDVEGFKNFVGNVEDVATDIGLDMSSDEARAFNSLVNDGTISIKCE